MRETMKRYLLPAVIGMLLHSPARAWQYRVAGTGGSAYGLDVAVDASGDVVTGGFLRGDTDPDFFVAKVAGASGIESWRYRLDGSGVEQPPKVSIDSAHRVAVDIDGSIYALGLLRNLATDLDGVLIKLSPLGAELWRADFVGAPNEDLFVDLALAPSPDPIVMLNDIVSSSSRIVRVDRGTGLGAWETAFPGLSLGALAIDPLGDVLATGRASTATTGTDVVVVKLDGTTGDELWRTTIDGGVGPAYTNDRGDGIACDGSGDVVVTGVANDRGTGDKLPIDTMLVVKLSGLTGNLLWRQLPVGHLESSGRTVRTNVAGDVFVVGTRQSKSLLALRLDGATGAQLWARRWTANTAAASDLVFDAAGDVVVAGMLRHRFTVAKVTADRGRARWTRRLAGNAYNGGQALALAVDSQGDVLATGQSSLPPIRRSTDSGGQLTTIKACGVNGRDKDPCPTKRR